MKFRNETVNERLKRTLERNRPKPAAATKKAVDLGCGEAGDLASATFDLPEVMRAQRLANRELAHQAREKSRQTVKTFEENLANIVEDVEEEYEEPVIRKPQKKAPAPINYIKKEKSKTRNFSFSFGEEIKVSRGLVYFGWAFCLFLVLRLTFAGGGIVDNVKKASILADKNSELVFTEQENIAVSKEIELIEKNGAYQRKLVRDNLGFIASDEYLVLFQEEKKSKSI